MKKHFLICVSGIVLGVLNYLIYRPNIILFAKGINVGRPFMFHFIVLNTPRIIRLFFSNYVSDILWALVVYEFSFLSLKLRLPIIYFSVLISLPILSEMGQAFGFFPGTFDFIDLGVYIILLTHYIKKNKHEIVQKACIGYFIPFGSHYRNIQ